MENTAKELLALTSAPEKFLPSSLRLAMEIEHSLQTTKRLSSRPSRRSNTREGCAQGRPRMGSRIRCDPNWQGIRDHPEFSLRTGSGRSMRSQTAAPSAGASISTGTDSEPRGATTTQAAWSGPLRELARGLESLRADQR